MPPVSQKQAGAMYAAAEGKGKLGIPVSVAKEFTGDGPPKKKTHRGRKPSGKPGASHLSALMKAHGAGDHKAAKTHALSYANEVHRFAQEAPAEERDEGMDETGESTGHAPVTAPKPMSGAFQALTMRKKK